VSIVVDNDDDRDASKGVLDHETKRESRAESSLKDPIRLGGREESRSRPLETQRPQLRLRHIPPQVDDKGASCRAIEAATVLLDGYQVRPTTVESVTRRSVGVFASGDSYL